MYYLWTQKLSPCYLHTCSTEGKSVLVATNTQGMASEIVLSIAFCE